MIIPIFKIIDEEGYTLEVGTLDECVERMVDYVGSNGLDYCQYENMEELVANEPNYKELIDDPQKFVGDVDSFLKRNIFSDWDLVLVTSISVNTW